jgi:hypothetical protein
MSERAAPLADAERPLQWPPAEPALDGAEPGTRSRRVIRCVVALMFYDILPRLACCLFRPSLGC